MKRYWIIVSALALIVYALFGVGGCFTGLTHIGGINNGGPTVGAKITAAALDVVTMPVQLPVFIIAGIGAGLDKLDRSIEDSAWRLKREDLHSKFLKDPERMQRETSPAFSHRGLDLGLVYKDEAIPLGERFLVANVMQYYAYVRGMSPIGGDDELAALLHRKEWTADGLRAVAPQIYLGRRHYPAPDYVTLAYLSNPKTPPDIIEAFVKHPSFKYRDAEDYCRTMRDEIATNIVARMERSMPPPSRGDEEDDSPEAQFTRFLGNNLGHFYEGETTWRVGGGMWDLCAVGTPAKEWQLVIGDAEARVVELYSDRPNREWNGATSYNGLVGAVVLEFDSTAVRDKFLKAVLPVCRYCGPECWTQLEFAPMDGSGEIYGICLEREKKSADTPSRMFIIRLDCPSEIRFWPPREYGSGHVWFADRNI